MEPALCELTESGFLYEAEMYPETVFAFRHPLTREVAYGTQLADRRAATHAAAARATIELKPDRHDELAALIAHHMEEGGETLEAARWSARAAYWAGHTRPQDALRLWQQVTELVDELEETEETTALAVVSRLLQLDYAWRLGMDRDAGRQAGRRGDGDRRADRRPALAGAAEPADRRASRGRRTLGRMDRRGRGGDPPGRRERASCDLRVASARRRLLRATCAPATSTASNGLPTKCSS